MLFRSHIFRLGLKSRLVLPQTYRLSRSALDVRIPYTGAYLSFQVQTITSEKAGLLLPPSAPGQMTAKRKPNVPRYVVGDRVIVWLLSGRVKEATIRAIIYFEAGTQVQVDFGNDETAFVYLWQIRPLDQ